MVCSLSCEVIGNTLALACIESDVGSKGTDSTGSRANAKSSDKAALAPLISILGGLISESDCFSGLVPDLEVLAL